MKKSAMKYTAVFLAVVMSIFVFSVNAAAMEVQPYAAVRVFMETDSGNHEVDAGGEFTVIVAWSSVFGAAGEPITLVARDGAEFLISNEDDVIFTTGGAPGQIGPVTVSPDRDVVTFTTGPLSGAVLDNYVRFQVKAPSHEGEFWLSAKIGQESLPIRPDINFIERSFYARPSFNFDLTESIVSEGQPFGIFGEFVNREDEHFVVVELRNKETAEVVYSFIQTDFAISGNRYEFNSEETFAFNSSYPEGVYIAEGALAYRDGRIIASMIREIEFVK